MENEARARITVFSGHVCPFCYLEEPDLDRRAYELRTDPVPTLVCYS